MDKFVLHEETWDGHRSSRHDDRDHRDRDRDYRRSRSPDGGRSSSRRDRDREFERERDYDRDRRRSHRDRERDYPERDYDRDRRGGAGDRRGGGRYDDGFDRRGPPPRGGDYYDDRRRGPPPRRGYSPPPPGGGRRRGGRGGPTFEGFGAYDERGNRARSPTPEDTIPISKRKRQFTAWDVKAPGFDTYTTTQAKMTGMFNLPGHTKPYLPPGVEGGDNPPLFYRPPVFGAVGPGAPIGSQARQSRRLYVGNVGMEATEESVRDFFNSKMAESGLLSDGHLGEDLQGLGLKGDKPVISVHLSYEKNYAFVEFRNAEEATNALGLDGIVYLNTALKVRRPKDYLAGDPNEIAPHVPGVVSTNVPDTVNKIFIGGLPSYLTDDQVMELLKSFGELRAFNLVKEGGTGASKGFAFCEYVDPAVTDIACQGLNGMELGDRYLVVQRAAIGANPAKHGPPGSGIGFPDLPPGAIPGLNQPPASIIAAGEAGEGQPTRVLQVLNMVSVDELANDQDYEEIVEDIKEECGKYGTVEDVKIPRPIKTATGKVDIKASESVKDLGKVLVLFEKEEQTTEALRAIAGRQFGGRLCICAYAPLEAVLE
ncbi:splicing factor U2AF 65 kDa subunit [Rhodotorula toruloides]|uniref:Splicing factor U2AF 65 kDa subunit n=1 Tax=Rhodotorula toruloides TaxID=5286 RepID=A0A511KL34_RHOTO|nr:splicing factor U2AF 65 kDa subunit [Rhodotorula toruloides]